MADDFSATISALDALQLRISDAGARIVKGAGIIFQTHARELAPIGVDENSTNPPGDLSRSIIVEDVVDVGEGWSTRVGPTVETVNPGIGGRVYNYGRLREFGGDFGPNVAPYLVFNIAGRIYRQLRVSQAGSFYLTGARQMGGDEIEQLMGLELTAALNGY